MTYAGFWKRFVAAMIDALIIYLTILLVIGSIAGGVMLSLGILGDVFFFLAMIVVYLMVIAYPILYGSLFESSSWQATPGKRMLGIKVTDMDGERISFKRALARNLLKIVSAAILYIGFIMIAFTEKKQGLHDIISDCLLIKR